MIKENKKNMKDETDKCYIDYERDEYDRGVGLTCTFNHSEGAKCLINACENCGKYEDCKCWDDYKNNK